MNTRKNTITLAVTFAIVVIIGGYLYFTGKSGDDGQAGPTVSNRDETPQVPAPTPDDPKQAAQKDLTTIDSDLKVLDNAWKSLDSSDFDEKDLDSIR